MADVSGLPALERDLNFLVPDLAGEWVNLIQAVGAMHGVPRLKLLGEVDTRADRCRLWGSAPYEGAYYSLLVVEFWDAHDPARDAPIPRRAFLATERGWIWPS